MKKQATDNQIEDNKKWLKQVQAEAKAKQKANKPAKEPLTIKVSTIVRIMIAITALVLAYVVGGMMNEVQSQSYKADVITEATAIVEQLKSSR